MLSIGRIPRAIGLASSVALIMAGLTLQPAAAISKGSHLVWLGDDQPATTGINTVITTEIGKPGGVKIKVAVLNGSGKRVRQAGLPIDLDIVAGTGASGAVLTGDSALTNGDGVAVFEPKIDKEHLNYQLVAKAADNASLKSGHIAKTPASDQFDIRDGKVTGCNGPCSDDGSDGTTTADVDANANGYLVFKLDDTGAGCGTPASKTLSFDVVGATGRTVVTLTLSGSTPLPDDVCLKKNGSASLLPDCVGTPATNDPACVESRTDPNVSPIEIVFSAPPGDPGAYLK